MEIWKYLLADIGMGVIWKFGNIYWLMSYDDDIGYML